MIQFPRRSVTRFFIPLVDVMILLFSMFTLLPIVQKAAESEQQSGERSSEELQADNAALQREQRRLSRELARLQKEVKVQEDVRKLREELERLRKEKLNVLQQRLAVRVLEIDPKNGDLIAYEAGTPPRPVVIDSKQAAAALIRRQQKEVAPRELYYLFLWPRVSSGFPEQRQLQQYQEWFRDVPFGMERPGLGGK